MPHLGTTYRLRRRLEAQAPAGFAVVDSGAGGYPNETNYLIPDLLISPGNPGHDYVLKRHAYAVAGVPQYWIADERDRSLHVLLPGNAGSYVERAIARPGQPWRSDEPFPLVVDPAEIFR